ncbi:MAG TPA: hypothetical protein VE783_05900 [Candidatus Limnocylindrales bacterium]|jgi:hypothetical protein|nr:hypothetical protein [Candidatus Limnocylindrales bacterium]
MGWIEEIRSRKPDTDATPTAFNDAAMRRWRALGEELRQDVTEFSSQQKGAEFEQPSESSYRVTNSQSGLILDLTADFEARVVRYDYRPLNDNSVGAPEGGMLSMRQRQNGRVEFYSADERLTSEETRQVLLEPVLFPPQLAA